jgi:hypothetical protein
VKIDKARELIKECQEYITVYESYEPKNVKQVAVKLYAELENVSKVAKTLNDKGYRKDGKPVAGRISQVKLDSNDVTRILMSEPDEGDQLHMFVRKALKRNRRRKGIV